MVILFRCLFACACHCIARVPYRIQHRDIALESRLWRARKSVFVVAVMMWICDQRGMWERGIEDMIDEIGVSLLGYECDRSVLDS